MINQFLQKKIKTIVKMPVQNLSYHKTTYQILQYDSTKKQYTWYQNEMSSHRDNTFDPDNFI